MANPTELLAQAVAANAMLPEASADAASAGYEGNPYANEANPSLIVPGTNPWGAPDQPLTQAQTMDRDKALAVNAAIQNALSTQPSSPGEHKQETLRMNSLGKMQTVAARAADKKQALSPADNYNNALARETGQGRDSASQLEKTCKTCPLFK